ncbi:hypothetical protein LTR86_000312 [Recurvomyces mirabilis]|nr:hypothetical protein LTR86_000312 [Recurvomyces mirabilis]
MRFTSLFAAAAALTCSTVGAQETLESTQRQVITSATTTYTITRTVERVVQTAYATMSGNGTSPASTTAGPSSTIYAYGNGTISSTGAAHPSASAGNQTARPLPQTGSGSMLSMDLAAIVAVAGMAGMLVL